MKFNNLGQEMITQKRLKELLDYDPATGEFRWRVNRGGIQAGSVAGGDNGNGYLVISIDEKLYRSHRLAWLFVYGYIPEYQIDHVNGKRADNRLANLREVSPQCNAQNRDIYSNNTSGFIGVSWHKRDRKWQARIVINGKLIYLGLYPTALEAALARYTTEVQCPDWTCNHRSELVRAIKKAWPKFQPTT